MRKTSVYLSDQDAASLRRAAARKGVPQAELIREGVRRVIAEADSHSRQFRSLGMGHGGGRAYQPWTSSELHDKAMGRR